MRVMPDNANDSRLRWRCRRGMLELDLLLNRFLDQAYQDLNTDQRDQFDQILDYPDPLLFDLLLGHMNSSDKGISDIVSQIRHATSP